MAKKLLFVFGTRPEAIKLAPLINRTKNNSSFDVRVCSTGQHREMLVPLLNFFKIQTDYDLDLMRPNQRLIDLTTRAMSNLDAILDNYTPDYLIVQGDTTTCMAASLVAFHRKVRVAHVEAGLRSGDLMSPWPEEFNRRVVTLTTQLHFAPTELAKSALLKEGVSASTVHVTGNTVIDALHDAISNIESDSTMFHQLKERYNFLSKNRKLVLVTTHRRESFDGGLENIMNALVQISKRDDVQILFPVHLNPNVRARVSESLKGHAVWLNQEGVDLSAQSILLCDPLPYFDFVYLMKRSRFIMSDSGGVQEEAPALGKPVLVLREVTERPEAVEAGTSKLVGYDKDLIIASAEQLLEDSKMYESMATAKNPFGDGHACEKIIDLFIKN